MMAEKINLKRIISYGKFFIGRVGVASLAFFADVVLSHVVALDQRGNFHVFMTTLSTFSLFLIIGLQNSVTVRAASAKSNGGDADISILWNHMILLVPSIFLAAVIPLFIPIKFLGAPTYVVFSCVTFMLIITILKSFLLGIGADNWYLTLMVADRLFLILGLITIVWWWGGTPTNAYLFSVILVFGLSLLFLNYSSEMYCNTFNINGISLRNSLRNILPFAGTSFLGNLFFQLMSKTSIYFLSEYHGKVEVSIFMTALLISQIVLQFPILISTVVFRDAAKEFNLNHIYKIAIISFVSATIISILIFPFRNLIVHLLYGAKYFEAGGYVGILLSAGVFMSPTILLMNAFLGRGYSVSYTAIFGIGFATNLLLSIFLIKEEAVEGAAIAVLGSSIICLVLSLIHLKYCLKQRGH